MMDNKKLNEWLEIVKRIGMYERRTVILKERN
jgi:hypothetical protein